MPWKHFPTDGGFKVWKIDDEGKKVGDPLSKKPISEQAAKNQVRALYASEKKETWTKEGKLYVGPNITQHYLDEAQKTGVNFYELLHEHYPGAIVAYPEMLPEELRPENKEAKGMMMDDEMPMKPMKDDMAGMMMSGPCSWDELDAMEQAEEMTESLYEMNDKMGMMARNIMQSPMIEDKAAALADLAKGYAERMGQMMTHPAEKSVDDIVKQIAGDSNQPEGDDRPDELKAVWTGKYIGSLPDSSFLYVEEGCKTKGCRHFPVKDAQGKLDLPHLRNAIARIPQSNAPGLSPEKKTQLQNRARKMLADAQDGKEAKDLFIWKEGDTYRWIAAYSNNRRDSDSPPEIISTESHKEFDEALHKGEWPMPEIWLWHIPYSIGATDYHAFDESTGFPVAAGHFYKGMEWAAEGVMQANWDGVSHGMPSEWIKRDEQDSSIIVRHRDHIDR